MSATTHVMSTFVDYKQQKTFSERLKRSAAIRHEHPDKIPIIIQRYWSERSLPQLNEIRFLVNKYCTMGELIQCVRGRLKLRATKSLYMIVNDRTLVSNSSTLCEVYELEQDDDGFLYMRYASENTFG